MKLNILIALMIGLCGITPAVSHQSKKLKASKFATTSATQFDLVCTDRDLLTGKTNSPTHVRIDLDKAEWCIADEKACSKPVHLSVAPDVLRLRSNFREETRLGQGVMEYWVDRMTAKMHYEYRLDGRLTSRSEGDCTKLPYGSVPRKAF